MKKLLITLGLLLLAVGASACLPAAEAESTPTITPTNVSSETPTPTIDWFPAIATATVRPTEMVTPTATPALALGAELLRDDFSSPGDWATFQTTTGSAQYGKERFTLAVKAAEGYLLSLRSTPELKDFYLEITASPSLCRASDSYGLYLRSGGEGYGYRWVVTCDGRSRLERVRDFHASLVEDWVGSPWLTPGSPVTIHLGVWMSGAEMRFYAEGVEIFRTREPLYASGTIGVFARASGDTPVTVSFSDLTVYAIDASALPTRTPYPVTTATP
ncbi:MAG TPA: hypothetical protein VN364_05585 [Bellilinea sp.]|nr:hypothetical protein [Bellilinea sp.]